MNETITNISNTQALGDLTRAPGARVSLRVPELLKANNKTTIDLMYGARLSQGTAYRLAQGRADGISFKILADLCVFFGCDVQDILKLHK